MGRTGCTRGGGVLIAAKKNLNCFASTKLIIDELLDQLFILTPLEKGLFCIGASYLPSNSPYNVYSAHVENVQLLYRKFGPSTQFAILVISIYVLFFGQVQMIF